MIGSRRAPGRRCVPLTSSLIAIDPTHNSSRRTLSRQRRHRPPPRRGPLKPPKSAATDKWGSLCSKQSQLAGANVAAELSIARPTRSSPGAGARLGSARCRKQTDRRRGAPRAGSGAKRPAQASTRARREGACAPRGRKRHEKQPGPGETGGRSRRTSGRRAK